MVDGSRRDLIEALAEEILHNYAHGRVIVAIDSEDVAAADAYGADLVELLKKRGHSAFAARMNDFVSPRERRRGMGTGLRRGQVPQHLRLLGSASRADRPVPDGRQHRIRRRRVRPAREQQIQAKWLTAPEDAILVLSRRVPAASRAGAASGISPRGSSRTPAEPADPLAVAARKLYAKDVKARTAASAIIDDTDPERPLRVFADSC